MISRWFKGCSATIFMDARAFARLKLLFNSCSELKALSTCHTASSTLQDERHVSAPPASCAHRKYIYEVNRYSHAVTT